MDATRARDMIKGMIQLPAERGETPPGIFMTVPHICPLLADVGARTAREHHSAAAGAGQIWAPGAGHHRPLPDSGKLKKSFPFDELFCHHK
jgi:hypothetical protein